MNLLEAARAYVEKGISVFPVGYNKKPIINWLPFQNRLPTDEELVEWFQKNKPSKPTGVGIVTGKISNLSVVDVDPRKGGTTKGLPPTLVAKTRAGGWHYYYRYLDGLRNKVDEPSKGIDIRSEGGYVVAPPSECEGGTYEWVIQEEPQPFPADFLDVPIAKTKVDWKKIVSGVEEGSRNATAAKFIGKLLQNFSPAEWDSAVWLTVLNWNRANNPPLPEKELRAVYNSITSREYNRRKSQEEDDAPVILMSDAVKKLASDNTIKFPTGFSLLDSSIKGGLSEGDVMLIVGETGHGKTTVAQTLTRNFVVDGNIPCLWFSFEMALPEVWEKFKAMGVEDETPIYTPERHVNGKIEWLRKKITEGRDIYKNKIVFIDHLGFLISEYKSGSETQRNLEKNLATVYGMICRDLKSLALQEGVAIILLWHTRRITNKAEPDADDIKDSASILQEMDVAINVSREKIQINKKTFGETASDVFGAATFIKMLKNRRTGMLKRFKCDFVNGLVLESEDARKEEEKKKNMAREAQEDSLSTNTENYEKEAEQHIPQKDIELF